MQGRPLATMHAMKNMDPNRIQRMVTNAMWHPKDLNIEKTQPSAQSDKKKTKNKHETKND
jgi:hypothetical protein